ncbi:MAG: type II toxin-antitoxin system RelE/ParE family toxin [Verrucomicrobia bacterium]|nr:type II toxin-antitoxin system RelE/ParE family toxin [Verrucomicrobiota bacterium]MBU1735144.1 type II toxin-antitoxin system RelE/ParE family toxin [Verrucomicrobiota bacterium]MBU1856636.1 type II toxin-antitoxin system RelE/ParE family toxin [Verrucomicrobiota bacterium]
MRIEILGGVQQDLIDGFRFYENQAVGLGDYFLDSLFSDIDSLHLYAGVHVLQFGYYRLLSKRFPFAIYYRVKAETIFVHAALDCRRDPARIQKRLT